MNLIPWVLGYLFVTLYHNSCSLGKPLYVEVGPGKEECFYERYEVAEAIEFLYIVRRGGQHDIEIKLYDPADRVMEVKKTSKYDRFRYPSAPTTGVYKICFNNGMSRWTSKLAGIELLGNHKVDSEHYTNLAKQSNVGKIVDDIVNVGRKIEEIEEMQEVSIDMEEAFWEAVMAGNSTIAYMTMIEATILIFISIFQIRQIRMWFKGGKEGFGV
ncbi:hypothetical protein RFI_36732 [Reticulomyxa filosa]|uniref:GOLD domain-containing protein n=1 Tax=Reticulomyxa filosa TaxID=46433 RepID=X6LFD4_RETFI|nr:hypothetical protein RFI_36732 [Reticulomyxa filosa]|eukprot:ETO00708.1 hypothetical protein RFI_36732 [Reticulomyxa filosa]